MSLFGLGVSAPGYASSGPFMQPPPPPTPPPSMPTIQTGLAGLASLGFSVPQPSTTPPPPTTPQPNVGVTSPAATAGGYASSGAVGIPTAVPVAPSSTPFTPSNPTPPSVPTSTSSPAVGTLTMGTVPAVGTLGGAVPSTGISQALTFAPGSVGYSTIVASPIPSSVMDVLKNPVYMAGAAILLLMILR